MDNFNIISSDPDTSTIFDRPPVVAYRRDQNIRNILVCSSLKPIQDQNQECGTYPCTHSRCNTCAYVSQNRLIKGPKSNLSINEKFTCSSINIIYAITCTRCNKIYIGETGRSLRERFGEHLRTIKKKTPGFPVAEHFSTNGHNTRDITIRVIKSCHSAKQRKTTEMKIIYKLGTLRPRGLNINFSFL